MANTKPKSKTLSTWRWLKFGKVTTKYVLPFAIPAGTASIYTLVHWEEWFDKAGVSLPFGFASLIVTVIVAVWTLLRSDKIFKKADVALLSLGAMFMCVGITCLFLASLFSQMGYMWLMVGGSLIGSAVDLLIEEKVIEPAEAEYSALCKEYGLDKRAARKQAKIDARRERAKVEAEQPPVE